MNKDEMMTLEEMEKIINEHNNYNSNCRIIAEDEIVIKKSELELATQTMKAFDDIYANGFVTLAKHHETINQIEKETAREILQDIKRFDGWNELGELCEFIANKYGIELE